MCVGTRERRLPRDGQVVGALVRDGVRRGRTRVGLGSPVVGVVRPLPPANADDARRFPRLGPCVA